MPLEWCFQAGVKLDFRHFPDGYVATAADVEAELKRVGHELQPLDIVVVNTRAGSRYGHNDYLGAGCGMGYEATMYLLERGVRLTGTDAWSWDAPFSYTAQEDRRNRRQEPDLGRPQGRPRHRLLPPREAAQPGSAARATASRSAAFRTRFAAPRPAGRAPWPSSKNLKLNLKPLETHREISETVLPQRRWALLMLGSAHAQTRVITLGTQGGPMPTIDRSQPANALLVDDRVYLIDAGNGVARQLVKAGIDHRRVGQIFITHNHDDHNSDWGTLMGYQWATGRRQPTTVYGPAGTEDMLKGFLAVLQAQCPHPHGRLQRHVAARTVVQGPGLQGQR